MGQVLRKVRRGGFIRLDSLPESQLEIISQYDPDNARVIREDESIPIRQRRDYTYIGGHLENDKIVGQCLVKCPDGSIFRGELTGDKATGKLTYSNGDTYQGEVCSQTFVPQGQGKKTTHKGVVYEGKFRDGVFGSDMGNEINFPVAEGTTTIRATSTGYFDWARSLWGGATYTGQIVKLQYSQIPTYNFYPIRQGTGRLEFPNGTYYEGQWEKGNKTGKGTLVYTGGITYKGTFKCGLLHGHGVATYPDGNVYSGYWRHGKRCGWGKLSDGQGNIIIDYCEWMDDHVKDTKSM